MRGRQPRRPPVPPPDAARDGQRAPADQIRRVARTRRERDSLGAKDVPARALYGLFTQRARETFQLSGRSPHPALIRAYARVKQAAALANARLGLLPRAWARAIVWAANRVAEGTVPDAAVLDAFKTRFRSPTIRSSRAGPRRSAPQTEPCGRPRQSSASSAWAARRWAPGSRRTRASESSSSASSPGSRACACGRRQAR